MPPERAAEDPLSEEHCGQASRGPVTGVRSDPRPLKRRSVFALTPPAWVLDSDDARHEPRVRIEF